MTEINIQQGGNKLIGEVTRKKDVHTTKMNGNNTFSTAPLKMEGRSFSHKFHLGSVTELVGSK